MLFLSSYITNIDYVRDVTLGGYRNFKAIKNAFSSRSFINWFYKTLQVVYSKLLGDKLHFLRSKTKLKKILFPKIIYT